MKPSFELQHYFSYLKSTFGVFAQSIGLISLECYPILDRKGSWWNVTTSQISSKLITLSANRHGRRTTGWFPAAEAAATGRKNVHQSDFLTPRLVFFGAFVSAAAAIRNSFSALEEPLLLRELVFVRRFEVNFNPSPKTSADIAGVKKGSVASS